MPSESGPAGIAARSALAGANPVIREPFEQAMNRSAYSDMPIVPGKLQRGMTQEQALPATGVIPRTVGAVTGAPPLRVEHALRGFGGGLGVPLATVGAPASTGAQPVVGGDEALGKIPVVGAIARRFEGPGTVDQREKDLSGQMTEIAQKAAAVKQTFDNKQKQSPRAAAEFMREPANMHQIVINSLATAFLGEMGKLRNVQNIISNSKMDNDTKLEKLHRVRQAHMQILEHGVEHLQRIQASFELKETETKNAAAAAKSAAADSQGNGAIEAGRGKEQFPASERF